MKRTLIALSLIVFPMAAIADFGIGVSFKSSEAGIYLPITITPRVFVEPYFQYGHGDSESNFNSSSTNLSVGAGLFGVSDLGDDVDFYYGARAAYLRQESSFGGQKSDADGFSIAPTLGFQYYLTDRLSLGAEVRWEFTELSGTRTFESSDPENYNSSGNGTRTDVLLRFYFK